MKARLFTLVLPLLLAAQPARAQGLEYRGSLWAAGVKARSAFAGGAEKVGGTVLGFESRVHRGRYALRLHYGQGQLEPDTAGPDARDYVEGSLLLSAALVKGLDVALGPFARAYTSTAGTQRWLFWQLRAHYEAQIVSPVVRGYAEMWTGLSGSVNAAEAYDGARGGAAGIAWRVGHLRGAALTLRLGYSIDEAHLGGNLRRETVEATTLAIGLER